MSNGLHLPGFDGAGHGVGRQQCEAVGGRWFCWVVLPEMRRYAWHTVSLALAFIVASLTDGSSHLIVLKHHVYNGKGPWP